MFLRVKKNGYGSRLAVSVLLNNAEVSQTHTETKALLIMTQVFLILCDMQ
jgi:hypothetical protein